MITLLRPLVFNAMLSLGFLATTAGIIAGGKPDTENMLLSVKVEQENGGITVSVKVPKVNTIQFYMFDADGLLISHLDLTGNKTVTINELQKETYLYEFFNNDPRLKSGQVELK